MVKVLLFLGMISLMATCRNNDGTSLQLKERKDMVLSRAEEQMKEEGTEFAFRFFKQVNQTEMNEPNWMVSPLSASLALGMLSNGAEGNTLTEMKNALGFTNSTLEEMNLYNQKLTGELLQLDYTTTLGIANSIWIQKGFKVYNPFVKVNKRMYKAKVSNLDFSSPKAPGVINDWCSDHTNRCIKDVVKMIPASARMYLLNALYFKGMWKEKFDEKQTELKEFYNADGSKSMVHTMQQTKSFLYTSGDNFSMAEFPYGNEAFSMVVILPDEGRKLDDVMDNLTFESWYELNQQLSRKKLEVSFPRFEVKYKKDLVDDMKALGMKDAFTGDANFSAISSSPLYVGLLEQYTYIKVDEQGTEAAAVTVVGLMRNAAPSSVPSVIPFTVNRPFAYIIKEKSTGAILFMGKVSKL